MTNPLRAELIEAAARALADSPHPDLSPDFIKLSRRRRAETVLTAFLDVLEERADETVHVVRKSRAPYALANIYVDELIQALRE